MDHHDFFDMKQVKKAVNDYKSHTKRFFIHATLFSSFKHPVKEIDDFYKLLNEQIENYVFIQKCEINCFLCIEQIDVRSASSSWAYRNAQIQSIYET